MNVWEELPLLLCFYRSRCGFLNQQFAVGAVETEHTRWCCMWRNEREPIERQKEGVVGVVLTVGAARGPSLTTDSTLSFPSGTPSLSSFLAVASFLFLVGSRKLLRQRRHQRHPLGEHPRPMPTHRSLDEPAVVASLSSGRRAARGARGADLSL